MKLQMKRCAHFLKINFIKVGFQNCISFSCSATCCLYTYNPFLFRLFSHVGHYTGLSKIPFAVHIWKPSSCLWTSPLFTFYEQEVIGHRATWCRSWKNQIKIKCYCLHFNPLEPGNFTMKQRILLALLSGGPQNLPGEWPHIKLSVSLWLLFSGLGFLRDAAYSCAGLQMYFIHCCSLHGRRQEPGKCVLGGGSEDQLRMRLEMRTQSQAGFSPKSGRLPHSGCLSWPFPASPGCVLLQMLFEKQTLTEAWDPARGAAGCSDGALRAMPATCSACVQQSPASFLGHSFARAPSCKVFPPWLAFLLDQRWSIWRV